MVVGLMGFHLHFLQAGRRGLDKIRMRVWVWGSSNGELKLATSESLSAWFFDRSECRLTAVLAQWHDSNSGPGRCSVCADW